MRAGHTSTPESHPALHCVQLLTLHPTSSQLPPLTFPSHTLLRFPTPSAQTPFTFHSQSSLTYSIKLPTITSHLLSRSAHTSFTSPSHSCAAGRCPVKAPACASQTKCSLHSPYTPLTPHTKLQDAVLSKHRRARVKQKGAVESGYAEQPQQVTETDSDPEVRSLQNL